MSRTNLSRPAYGPFFPTSDFAESGRAVQTRARHNYVLAKNQMGCLHRCAIPYLPGSHLQSGSSHAIVSTLPSPQGTSMLGAGA